MTGNDDGGFSPHPGDPWHPGWNPESEVDDDVVTPDGPETDEATKPKKRRFGRRSKEAAAVEDLDMDDDDDESFAPPVAPPVTPESPVEEVRDADDPFDAVLRAEGRSVRGRPADGSDAPAPAWTSDEEIPDELTLPVAPPSWVGDTTATDPAIESTGFEPVSVPETSVDQPDLFAPPAEPEPAAGDGVTVEDEPVVAEAEPTVEIAGEHGVAGPEAFEVLAESGDEDLGDWEAFMEGAADSPAESDVAAPVEFAAPAEPVGDVEAIDEWVESEPQQKRRWFRRRGTESVAGEEWEGIEDAVVDDPIVDDTVFMPPPVPAETPQPEGEDPDAAVAEALAALGAADVEVEPVSEDGEDGDELVWVAADEEATWVDEVLGTTEETPEPVADELVVDESIVDAPVADTVEPEDLEDAEPDAEALAPTPEADFGAAQPEEQPFFLGELPESDDGDPVADEVTDWDGDATAVPSSWFADVDEDSVVPPVAADTPETEWPATEGPWEGRAAWEAEESTEVFDVESAPVPVETPIEPVPTPEPVGPVVPEGYQEWGEAVADATAAGEETAEYHVQHVTPPAQELPEGFEPFPGSEAEVAYGDGPQYPEDPRMGSDDTFDDTPVTYVDDDGSAEFDEQIYAGGGTIEHRGLAEAIAAVGEDDDTEWQAMSAAMPGVETGVLGFEDVADLANGDEYVAPVRSNFGMRVVTGLVLAGMLFGSLFVGGWAFTLFVGAIVLLGLGELYATLSRQGYLPLTIFGLVGAAGTLAAAWFHGPVAIPSGVMLTAVVVFFFYAFAPTRRDALTNGGVTLLGLAWAVGGIAFAIPIARGPEFEVLVVAVVVCTAVMDIGAYTFGRRFGRRPLAPILSPNKTVEGFIGGTLAAMAAAAAFGWFEMGPFDLMSGLALGGVVVVMAPLGDLAESMVKRSMGVKDMGSTLPGHGGVLDRIDALVFVIPAAWVLFEVLGYLG